MNVKGTENTFSHHPRELLRFFVTAPPTGCPYGHKHSAHYKYGCFTSLPDPFMGYFLANGFRRNGSCLYTMECPDCSACVPIRLQPKLFIPNRSQRRVLRQNHDVTVEIAPIEIDPAKLALCDAFLNGRYPEQEGSGADYYHGFFVNTLCNTVEFRYRVNNRLLGVGIVDFSSAWLNAVYFFFDPQEKKRSPGIFNILTMVEFCQQHDIESLYLGYWIENCRAMSYKANFRPHQLFRDNRWISGRPDSLPPLADKGDSPGVGQ